MKNRLFSLLTSLVMVISLLGIMPAMSVGALESGDYEYEILDDGTVEITAYTGSATNLTIPSTIGGKTVTSIGSYAFADCDSLTSVTIPDSVTSIGRWAFYNCDSLTSVTIGNGVTSIGDYAFAWCKSLTSITIPDSVTSIGDGAFEYCDSLTSITIPDSVTSIGNYAFSHCTSLNSITIGNGVTHIWEGAFAFCDSLTSINVNANNKYYSSVDGVLFNKNKTILIQYPIGNKRNSYTIPDSVISIDIYAFAGCDSLTSITFPDSVTSIGSGAFLYCDSLTSINVNTNNKYYSSVDGVLFNKNKTELIQYPIGNKRNSYTIPDSVTSIGYRAFFSCDSLTSIIIPDSVTYILGEAFRGCDSLTSVTIPDSVTSIGDYAFFSCDRLTIKCYENSTAHQYAIDNYILYELLDSVSVTKPTSFKMALNSSSSVRLSWNKVSGANGYILEQYKSGKWTGVAKITSPSTVQYSVKGLASGTTYKFRMKAYKTISGNTVYSDYTNTLTTCTKPATPKAKMAANSTSSIRLSWDKITGAGGYIVEQYKGGKWVRLTKITSPSTIQYSVKGLASGTTYKFRVRAYKMLSGKAYYSDYSSTVTTCTKPATVKFTLTPGSRKATVKWSKVTGASGYIVYYKTSANGSWTRLKKVGSSTTSYTKTGLTKGKTYYFTVKPYKTLGGKVYYGGITSKSVKVK